MRIDLEDINDLRKNDVVFCKLDNGEVSTCLVYGRKHDKELGIDVISIASPEVPPGTWMPLDPTRLTVRKHNGRPLFKDDPASDEVLLAPFPHLSVENVKDALFKAFIAKLDGSHSWPGNVRDLLKHTLGLPVKGRQFKETMKKLREQFATHLAEPVPVKIDVNLPPSDLRKAFSAVRFSSLTPASKMLLAQAFGTAAGMTAEEVALELKEELEDDDEFEDCSTPRNELA